MNKQFGRGRSRSLKRLLAGGAGLMALAGAMPSFAADADAKAGKDATEVGEIVVTGTSIRGIEPTGSLTLSLDHKDIQNTGLNTIAEVARTLPTLQALGYDSVMTSAQSPSGNENRGTTLNLRGLGQVATLVLVDGRRPTPSGTISSYVDANQIPLIALERIEVVPDGASGIYGSDAVAGVVNFIMRKTYDGLEVGGRYTTNHYYDKRGASAIGGKQWASLWGLGGGGVTVALDWEKDDSMRASQSPLIGADLRAYGGVDNRINGTTAQPGSLGNLVVTSTTTNPTLLRAGFNTYYGIPNLNGATPTVAQLTANLNQPNLVDANQYFTLLPEVTRKQFSVYFHQTLAPDTEFYLEAYGTKRRTQSTNLPTASILNTAGTPYYIAGIPGVAATATERLQLNLLPDLGLRRYVSTDWNYNVTAGIDAKIRSWNAGIYYTVGQDESCGTCIYGNNVNAVALLSLVQRGIYNPYLAGAHPADVISQYAGSQEEKAHYDMNDVGVKFDGPLFTFNGNAVKGAVGGEYRHIENGLTNFANSGVGNAVTRLTAAGKSRNIKSAYAEIAVPLIGEQNNLPLIRGFDVDYAIRYDDYSDFGPTTNHKVGVVWKVDDDLKIRGSWGTSFRAPNLPDIDIYQYSSLTTGSITNNAGLASVPIDNPANRTTIVLASIGANPDLKPETAKTYSVGFDYQPSWLKGFRGAINYFNVEYIDQITYYVSYTQYLATAENARTFSKFIIPTPETAACVNGNQATYNPALLPWVNQLNLYGQPVTDPCSIKAVIDNRQSNTAQQHTDGLDFQASYAFEGWDSNWAVGLAATETLHNKFAKGEGATEVELNNTINNPVKWKARGSLSWDRGPFSANLFMNYVGSYLNNLPLTVNGVLQPNQAVKSWTTFDLGLAYNGGEEAPSYLSGVRVSLNVLNLLDKDPPLVLSTNSGGASTGSSLAAFDTQQANAWGRIYELRVSKRF